MGRFYSLLIKVRTDNEIKEKFQNNYLSHPLVFEEMVFLPDNNNYKDEPSALELVGILVVAGAILYIWF